MPKTIRVLAFANVQLLDVTGPLQVFASANDIARQKGLPPPYAPTVIASGGGAVMSSAGLALLAEPLAGGGQRHLDHRRWLGRVCGGGRCVAGGLGA